MKRIVSASLVVLLLAFCVVQLYAVNESSASGVKAKLDSLQENQELLQNEIENTDSNIEDTQQELELIAEQIAQLELDLSGQEAASEAYDTTIVELRQQIDDEKENQEEQFTEMKAVVRAMEEAMCLIIWTEQPDCDQTKSENANNAEICKSLVEYEKSKMDKCSERESTLKAEKDDLQAKEAAYWSEAQALEELSRNYTSQLDKLNDELETLQETSEDLHTAYNYYESDTILSEMDETVTTALTDEQIEAYLCCAYKELQQNSTISEKEKEMRLALLEHGLGLVGRVPYWYGGRSYSPGWNSEWGTMKTIRAAGSAYYTLGKAYPYGLDCGGFVFWCYLTLYGKDSAESPVSWMAEQNASGIYNNTNMEKISWEDKLPGDVVVNGGSITHIGLYLCSGTDGSPIYLHCAGQKGVIVSMTCNFVGAARLKEF